ncbi:hypothetical protein CO659_21340 [Rhizobium sp. S9]|nr:hypothetical protein CO659_21340 [Rhizobium sp. S9]
MACLSLSGAEVAFMVKPLFRRDNLICAERQAKRVIGGRIVDDGAMGGGARSAFQSADRRYWDD